ncbi:MAG: hypothetical protein E7286_00960 [Lachnospiraceae bacterium]|nr:hypothetical protein [Lachnospiraceae bacterium]
MNFKMKINKNRNKKLFHYLYILSVVLIFLYPFRHVAMGVDLMDGGYNYANFRYNGLEYMDSMWFFATWMANAVGHLFTQLPFGDTLLGMNVYATLPVSAIGVSAYIFSVKELKIPAWIAFIGEWIALSLCWAPVSVLYNYLTYGFLLAGVLCLYQGLTASRGHLLVLAGIFLGLNVGNRFSNLPQAGLILAVWYFGIINKKKFSFVLKDTAFCVLGYVAALAVFLGFISLRYGFGSYAEAIVNLFGMTEQATDYTPLSMLSGMIGGYLDDTSMYWIKRFGLILAAALVLCLTLARKNIKTARVLTGISMPAGMWWLVTEKFLYRDYATYNSIYDQCIMVFLMMMLLAVWQMYSRKYTGEEKLQAFLVILLILFTSLGSNNAIYSSINNLFWVLPCAFGMLCRFVCREKSSVAVPFQGILLVGCLFLVWQGAFFGKTYVYEEATGGRSFDTEITAIPVLKGISTNQEKARHLEELYAYLQESGLDERECILFGNIPGVAYFLDLTPAMNVWSDLRSYSVDRMESDVAKLDMADSASRPIIILEEKAFAYLQQGGVTEENLEETAAKKLHFLGEQMADNGYRQEFFNGKYAVYY